jgi:hypothetical protein
MQRPEQGRHKKTVGYTYIGVLVLLASALSLPNISRLVGHHLELQGPQKTIVFHTFSTG